MDQIEGILNLIKDEDLERLGKLNEVDKCNGGQDKGLMKLGSENKPKSPRNGRCVIDKRQE